MIEARGVGILAGGPEPKGPVPLELIVDLDKQEIERLPPERKTDVLSQKIPCLHRVESQYFPAAILQYLLRGRVA